MPKLQFTPEELKGYFKENVRHHFYEQTVEKAESMRIHSDGLFPEKLIRERRPHEPLEVMEYRHKIYESITEPVYGRVINSLYKIRRSADWNIQYANQEKFTKIVDEETLEQYCEKRFPKEFTSVTNWIFDVLLKKYGDDPNAVVFDFPLEINIEENEYLKPFPIIFDSCDVINFVPEDFAILRNPIGSVYYIRGKQQKGDSFYVVTTERIQRYDQINSKGDIAIAIDFIHNLPILPATKIRAIISQAEGNQYLYKSRLSGMVHELNEASREYSDLQAAKVNHIYPERWEFTQNECSTCKGTGRRRNPRWFEGCAEEIAYEIDCDNKNCHNGYIVAGPFSKILVRPTNNATESTTSIPTPPAGYVEKDVDVVKVQDEGIDKHLFKALAAINFQFLDQSPLNQSGTAKEVDKDELNNTVHAIAEDLVRIMDFVYKITALTRYNTLYSNDDILEFMVPKISVPEKFDILSASHLEQELANAKTNNLNPVTKNAMEIEYVSKRFNTDPSVRDLLTLIFQLDPLPNISEDEKMSRLSNKGITQETYVISSNIHEFVQQALDENPDFAQLPLKEQKAKMKEYAKEQIQAQDEAKNITKGLTEDTGLDPVTGLPLMQNGIEDSQQVNNNIPVNAAI